MEGMWEVDFTVVSVCVGVVTVMAMVYLIGRMVASGKDSG